MSYKYTVLKDSPKKYIDKDDSIKQNPNERDLKLDQDDWNPIEKGRQILSEYIDPNFLHVGWTGSKSVYIKKGDFERVTKTKAELNDQEASDLNSDMPTYLQSAKEIYKKTWFKVSAGLFIATLIIGLSVKIYNDRK